MKLANLFATAVVALTLGIGSAWAAGDTTGNQSTSGSGISQSGGNGHAADRYSHSSRYGYDCRHYRCR